MFKLCILSLCVVAALATPPRDLDGSVIRTMEPLTRIINTLNQLDGNPAACLEDLKAALIEAFKKNGQASRDCVADCVPEVMEIHEQVWQSLQAAAAAIEEEYQNYLGCTNLECKVESGHKIVGLIAQNIRDNAQIIKEGIKAIAAVYPEAWECTKDVFIQLDKELEQIEQDFLECVHA